MKDLVISNTFFSFFDEINLLLKYLEQVVVFNVHLGVLKDISKTSIKFYNPDLCQLGKFFSFGG